MAASNSISGSLSMAIDVSSTTVDINTRNWQSVLCKCLIPWNFGTLYQVISDTVEIPVTGGPVIRPITGASEGAWPVRALANPADPTLVGKKIIAFAISNTHATSILTVTWIMGMLIVPAGQTVIAYKPAGVTVPMAPSSISLSHGTGALSIFADIVIVYQ